jgi:hypothetical protein
MSTQEYAYCRNDESAPNQKLVAEGFCSENDTALTKSIRTLRGLGTIALTASGAAFIKAGLDFAANFKPTMFDPNIMETVLRADVGGWMMLGYLVARSAISLFKMAAGHQEERDLARHPEMEHDFISEDEQRAHVLLDQILPEQEVRRSQNDFVDRKGIIYQPYELGYQGTPARITDEPI